MSLHCRRSFSMLYLNLDVVVLPGPALTPDQDGLHLRRERLLPGDAQLQSQTCVCRHASTLAVSEHQTLFQTKEKYFLNLRVESWSGILHLFNETGHVLEEEVVQVLLLHVLQLEGGLVASTHHPGVCVSDVSTMMRRVV